MFTKFRIRFGNKSNRAAMISKLLADSNLLLHLQEIIYICLEDKDKLEMEKKSPIIYSTTSIK